MEDDPYLGWYFFFIYLLKMVTSPGKMLNHRGDIVYSDWYSYYGWGIIEIIGWVFLGKSYNPMIFIGFKSWFLMGKINDKYGVPNKTNPLISRAPLVLN